MVYSIVFSLNQLRLVSPLYSPVVIASVGSIFTVHKRTHERGIPACSTGCHRLHLQHELLGRHIHGALTLHVAAVVVVIIVMVVDKTVVVVAIVAVILARVGSITRRNGSFLLWNHHRAVAAVIVAARRRSMRRAAVTGTRRVS